MGTHPSPLCGFLDRRAFLELTDLELKRCRRYHQFVSLVLLDCQSLGACHPGLSRTDWMDSLARLVKERVRDSDLLGGFQAGILCVLLPHSTRAEAYGVGNRLSAWITECLAPAGPTSDVAVRIGVAVYPSRAVTVEDLFADAIRSLTHQSVVRSPWSL